MATSNALVFTTDFYTKQLEKSGTENISRWCCNRNLDIFSKKVIMFPINMDKHQSLCCLINLCNINIAFNNNDSDRNTELP